MSEISCKITNTFLKYVKSTRPELLKPLLEGLPFSEEYLSNTDNWIPWDIERVMEERLVQLFDNENIMFEIGRSVLNLKSLGILNVVSKLFLTPELLIKYAPRIASYFTKDVVRVNVLEASKGNATVELKIKGKQTRGACLYNQGLFSTAATLFGLEPAEISETQCVVPINEAGRLDGNFYQIDKQGNVIRSYSNGSKEIIGHISDNCSFQLNGILFGAESCIYKIRWKNKKSANFKNNDDKKEALLEAIIHLEENYAKLQNAYDLLRRSEEKYRDLMENAGDIIFLLTPEGIIKSVNRKGTELAGYNTEEFIGQPFIDFVADAFRDEAAGILETVLNGGSMLFEFPIETKKGTQLLLSFNSNPIIENNKIDGLMLIARDVTSEREVSARLLEAEKFAAKGVIAAEIAHEINNSLANIETAHYILNNMQLDPQHRKEILKEVQEEIERMSGIVKSILDVYRSDDSSVQAVDVNLEINKVINLTKRRLSGKGITIISELSSAVYPFPCCPGHIKQILLNLIKNAEDALLSSNTKLINISTKIDENHIEIKVKDTGHGMSQEILDRLSSRMFTSKVDGTGLGLSICKGIISKYNGSIDIQSELGKGTTVKILFPLSKNG